MLVGWLAGTDVVRRGNRRTGTRRPANLFVRSCMCSRLVHAPTVRCAPHVSRVAGYPPGRPVARLAILTLTITEDRNHSEIVRCAPRRNAWPMLPPDPVIDRCASYRVRTVRACGVRPGNSCAPAVCFVVPSYIHAEHALACCPGAPAGRCHTMLGIDPSGHPHVCLVLLPPPPPQPVLCIPLRGLRHGEPRRVSRGLAWQSRAVGHTRCACWCGYRHHRPSTASPPNTHGGPTLFVGRSVVVVITHLHGARQNATARVPDLKIQGSPTMVICMRAEF